MFARMGTAICKVYMATNRVNGKRYIGFTSRSMARRAYEHEWEATKSKRVRLYIFHKAIRAHGADMFDWTILADGLSQPDALALEEKMVAELKPEYNSTAGGKGSAGRVRSAEERARQSALMKGRRNSPEALARMAAKLRGGKRTQEQRERISASVRGKPKSAEHRAALSAAHQGVKLSEKHRAALSAAMYRRYSKGA